MYEGPSPLTGDIILSLLRNSWERTNISIKCNPWSTRLCPHPSLIKKMRTYLKVEGKLGPKPRQQPQPQQNKNQPGPVQLSTNPLVKRGTKTNDKGRTLIPTRWYKVWEVTKPIQAPTSKADMWPCKCPWLYLSQWWIWQRENSKKIPPKEVP